ncbi:replication initiator protein [Dipodfec virus RodF1_24]|uniref:Replication initiator protein n=1 Tax=Dipodfec virus RodF1_24 TaxID=2929294 RepID=A0A976N395_9VIRU|nr:replication initiator protein [Dipodfec virus RodF1_24]
MCYQPKKYRNKYGDVILVDCGYCADCLNKKSFKHSLLSSLEAQQSKYTYFITLTYHNSVVPLCRAVKQNGTYTRRGITDSPLHRSVEEVSLIKFEVLNNRLRKQYENTENVAFLSPAEYSKMCLLFEEDKYKYFKSKGDNVLPFLAYSDVQRFFKRLRINIRRSFEDPQVSSVRYFVAGEYGPTTLRPHWHILLFSDSDELQPAIEDLVRKSWKYGRSDTQLSKGGATNYCAQYVNGSNILPSLYNCRFLRPKTGHSSDLGRVRSSFLRQGVDAFTFENISNYLVNDGSKVRYLPASFSLECSLFPKCFRYGQASDVELFDTYVILASAFALFGTATLVDLATYIFTSYYDDKLSPYWRNKFAPIFVDDRLSNGSFLPIDVMLGRIYSALSLSSMFLRNCDLLGVTPWRYLKVINSYYSDKKLSGLSDWYADRENNNFLPTDLIYDYDNINFDDSITKDFISDRYIPLSVRVLCNSIMRSDPTYDLGDLLDAFSTNHHLDKNPRLQEAKQVSTRIVSNKTKHKAQNELNNIFLTND